MMRDPLNAGGKDEKLKGSKQVQEKEIEEYYSATE